MKSMMIAMTMNLPPTGPHAYPLVTFSCLLCSFEGRIWRTARHGLRSAIRRRIRSHVDAAHRVLSSRERSLLADLVAEAAHISV